MSLLTLNTYRLFLTEEESGSKVDGAKATFKVLYFSVTFLPPCSFSSSISFRYAYKDLPIRPSSYFS